MTRLALALAGVLGVLAGCGEPPPDDERLEGPCEVGDTQCVGTRSIQVCETGEWEEPQQCEPEVSTTEGGFTVELETWCTDGYCRPGG